MQAKLVFEGVGLHLTYRAHDEEPYHESYSGTKEDLLLAAVRELRRRNGISGSFFFIEDTSIRIEGLSGDKDYPGLAAKEWFQEHSFKDLERELADANSDDRRVAVFSSIALAVPGRERPILFHGETRGLIAGSPAEFEPDPLFPWLSPDNFSAWFVPDGATRTLSEMSFEESLEHDFRVRALLGLIDRLEEYASVLNAPPSVFERSMRDRSNPYTDTLPSRFPQDTLFPIWGQVILAIGPTCSGKSTMGIFALESDQIACHVVDASAIVRGRRQELAQENLEISEFSRGLLASEGADVVARIIASRYEPAPHRESLVVTGFRTIEEVLFFRRSFANVAIVSIETPARVRYERYLRRATRAKIASYVEFKRHDNEQNAFGLLRVAPLLSDIRLMNVYSRDVYYEQCAKVLGMTAQDVPGLVAVSSRINPKRSQLYRCLVILRQAGRPLTTQEIQEAFEPNLHIRYNNANKILKRYPELVQRQESDGSNVKYHITQNGLAFIAAVDWFQTHG